MKELTSEDYKRIPFEILLDVDDFCKKNNIRYSLAYGTLLGAIRHKGFIPWDDDIDIIMPRSDYEIFKKQYKSDRYVFSDISVNPNHPTRMGKVFDTKTFFYYKGIKRDYGLFVDVFVVDSFPSNKTEKDTWLKKIRHYQLINEVKNTKFVGLINSSDSLKLKLYKCFKKLTLNSKNRTRQKIIRLSQKYNGENTGYVGITVSVDNPWDTYPSDLFEKYIDVQFEGHRFRAISDYDQWLTVCYGNYMQLPPKEKRIGKHSIIAYYR